jgi:catechol 2,3-dioxygenase-like lactoylglutathione lyase family enzyme
MFRFKGIHHLAMATGDMNRTIRFWRDLLGMRMVAGLGNRGYKLYFFEIAPQNFIVFFEWPKVEPVAEKDHGYPVSGPFVFDHVAFGVEDRESLWDLRDRIDAAGFWVSDVIDHGIIHSIYCFDPNGIPIEFSVAVEGVDIGRNPKLVDSAPVPTALEGTEPLPEMWPRVVNPTPLDERDIFPGEGVELVDGKKKNWWDREEADAVNVPPGK